MATLSSPLSVNQPGNDSVLSGAESLERFAIAGVSKETG